jgi:hypothetical protein
MSSASITVQGVIRPDGKLEVNESIPLPAGQVQVTIRCLERTRDVPSAQTLAEVLREIHAARSAQGVRARSRDELDQEIQQLRREWVLREESIDKIRAGVSEAEGRTTPQDTKPR